MASGREWWKDFFDPAFYTPGDEFHLRGAPKEARLIRRALGLRRGLRVLDLCCGTGRHSLELAAGGCRVVGVDASEPYLRRAAREARRRRLDASFLLGDMRRLAFRAEFDAAFNFFTSFGYFPKASDDLRVLRGVLRALRPGAPFLIDLLDGEWTRENFQARDWSPLPGGGVRLEERRLEGKGRLLRNRWTNLRRGFPPRTEEFVLRLYDRPTLSALLRSAGFRSIRAVPPGKIAEYGLSPARLVLLARKVLK